MRMPVCRSVSTAAQVQNARSSSPVRSRRLPVAGSVGPDPGDRGAGRPRRASAGRGERRAGRRCVGGLQAVRAVVDQGVHVTQSGQDGQPFPGALVRARLAGSDSFCRARSSARIGHGRRPRSPIGTGLPSPTGRCRGRTRGPRPGCAARRRGAPGPRWSARRARRPGGSWSGRVASTPRRPRAADAASRCRGGGVPGRARTARPGWRPDRARLVWSSIGCRSLQVGDEHVADRAAVDAVTVDQLRRAELAGGVERPHRRGCVRGEHAHRVEQLVEPHRRRSRAATGRRPPATAPDSPRR